MANRNFARDAGSLEKGLVKLFAHVSFGSTGAPTLVRGRGIASVSRSSAGKFVVALQDPYQRLLGCAATFVVETGVPAAPVIHVVSDASATASAPAVTIQTGKLADGAATDPANGEAVLVELTFSNSINV